MKTLQNSNEIFSNLLIGINGMEYLSYFVNYDQKTNMQSMCELDLKHVHMHQVYMSKV